MLLDILGTIGTAFGIGNTIGNALFNAGGADRGDSASPAPTPAPARDPRIDTLVALGRDNSRLLGQLRDVAKGIRRGPPAPLPPRPVAQGTYTQQGPAALPSRPPPADTVQRRAEAILEGLPAVPPGILDPNNPFWRRVRDPDAWWNQPLFPGIGPFVPPQVTAPPRARAEPRPGFTTGGSLDGAAPALPGESDAVLEPTVPGAGEQRNGSGSGPSAPTTGGGSGSSAAAAAGGGRSNSQSGARSRSRSSSGSRASGGSASCTVVVTQESQMSRMGNRKVSSRGGPTRAARRPVKVRTQGRNQRKPRAARAASPAQIAARQRFAERARAGTLRRRKAG